MESCGYLREGNRCGSKDFTKEVEFRHPTYKELNLRLYLCRSHFALIFGQQLITHDHLLPLEEQTWLLRQYVKEKDAYEKELEDVIEKVRVGIGLEHFDLVGWKRMRYQKVDHAYKNWEGITKKQCRFEWCKKRLTNWNNMYVIRVYPKNSRDYINLLFCQLDHWEVFKKRIGLETLKGKLDKTSKVPAISLDTYTQHEGVIV